MSAWAGDHSRWSHPVASGNATLLLPGAFWPARIPPVMAALPGFGDQREIELLVEAGFTPVQAIRIATLNGAIWKERSIGLVEGLARTRIWSSSKAIRRGKLLTPRMLEIVFKDGIGYDRKNCGARSLAGTVSTSRRL